MISYNEGAEIVQLGVLGQILRALPLAGNATPPDGYSRAQLLTEDAARILVETSYDRSYIEYGADSPDFPLCRDFARVAAGDVLREAIKSGLAVRPAVGLLEYTKGAMEDGHHARHAIVWAALADRRVLFYEPQTGEWIGSPVDAISLDRFVL